MRTYVRSPATWVRGACPSKRLSSRFGSGASLGFEPEGRRFFLEYALTRPFSLMIREMRLLDATMPRFSSIIFIFGAPYSRNPSSWALTTSSVIGSRGLSPSGCPSIQ